MPKVAVIADFLEERWPSMDLCADLLAKHLNDLAGVEGQLVRPRLKVLHSSGSVGPSARAIGRFVQLPLQLATARPDADYFHIADHSYAHLALLFPERRVGVYCHDVDAFRAALPGAREPRWRVLLSQLLLTGMRHARVVFHNTRSVRDEILRYGLVPSSRLVHARLGAADEFLSVEPGPPASPRYLMHVGSCIPRKNVDFLLQLFVELARQHPELRLVQVGGEWTAPQRELLTVHRLDSRIEQIRGIPRVELARLYARAAMVLVPSLSEGFGLPVIEALASGAPVVASDLAVFRELEIEGLRLCTPSAMNEWTASVNYLLRCGSRPSPGVRELIRSEYSWHNHAAVIANAYVSV